MAAPRNARWATAALGLAAVIIAALALSGAGCTSNTSAGVIADAEPLGVWWTGDGAFAVAQLASEDVGGVVLVWDRRVGKTFEPQEGYRVVAVEKASPRVWLVPDQAMGDSSRSDFDLAGDTADSKPASLLLWDLSSGKGPTDDAEARWRAWPGSGGFTAYPEVDVLKGALVARLLFQPSSGETEGAKAAYPEGVVTLDPIGWSPSGKYFAAMGLGEGDPRLLVFDPATGSVVASETALPPVGGIHAAWGTAEDTLHWFGPDLSAMRPPEWLALPYPAASSYRPPRDSALLGMVPAGALILQPANEQGSGAGVIVLADPEAGGQSRAVLKAEDAYAAFDGQDSVAVLERRPLRLRVQPVNNSETAETVWEAK